MVSRSSMDDSIKVGRSLASHSSCCSTRTTPASRSRAVGSGNTPTTSVRLFISLFTRSSGLVDQICRQYCCGKQAKVSRSSLASSSIVATFGWDLASRLVTSANFSRCAHGRASEDRADDQGDDTLTPFRHDREHVAHDKDPAPVPRSAPEDGANRFLQA